MSCLKKCLRDGRANLQVILVIGCKKYVALQNSSVLLEKMPICITIHIHPSHILFASLSDFSSFFIFYLFFSESGGRIWIWEFLTEP